MAWIIGGAMLAGGLISKRGQANANSANAALSREQMDWEERMSNTAVQRRVADLKAAGLNPMLAYNDVASTPSYQRANMENEDAALGNAVTSAAQGFYAQQQMKAQTAATQAAARKTEAEAKVIEAQLPYSAANAKTQSQILERQFEKLGAEVESAFADWRAKQMDVEQLKPLAIKYQELLNQAEKLGLSEKEATSEFFRAVPQAKWLDVLKQLGIGYSSVIKAR